MRDLLLCLCITANLLIYGFIGMNYGAFQKVMEYKRNVPNSQQLASIKDPKDLKDSKDLKEENPSIASLNTQTKILTLKSSQKKLKSWQGTVSIPSLNINAPLQHFPDTDIEKVQDLLSEGSISLTPFIPPSIAKRMLIYGHSSDYRWKENPYSNLFALLPQIQIGETITLSHQNQNFHYTVKKTQITASDLKELISEEPQHNELILSTCYPIGFFSQRFNVIAVPTVIPPATQISPLEEKSNNKNEMRNKIQTSIHKPQKISLIVFLGP